MALEKELDIAQEKRRQAMGTEPKAAPAAEEGRESMIGRMARNKGYRSTMDAGSKLQDAYRAKHGLDQYNRPMKRTASRSSTRR